MTKKFHSQTTLFESVGRRVAEAVTGKPFNGNSVEFYELMLDHNRQLVNQGMPSEAAVQAYNTYILEKSYYENRRPYYLVHEPIIKSLSKMRIDVVTVDMVDFPVEIISMRLPVDNRSFYIDSENQGRLYCKTILCWLHKVIDAKEAIDKDGDLDKVARHRTVTMYFDFGEQMDGIAIASWAQLVLHEGWTIQQCVDDVLARRDQVDKEGHSVAHDISADTLKRLSAFVVGLGLLSQSAEDNIIVPDVLNKDRDKFKKSNDPKYVDKAHRTGKIGWEIGAGLEVSPHYRSGTPLAIYWTGKGRTQMILRSRKSTFVHRKKLEEIPTGFEDETTLSEVKHDSEDS